MIQLSTKSLSQVSPAHGSLAFLGQLAGTINYEIRMQWRRWGSWIAFGCVVALFAFLFFGGGLHRISDGILALHWGTVDLSNYVAYIVAYVLDLLFPPLAALMVSDRLIRDSRLKVAEMQQATPRTDVTYILGKFLGSYIATLVPTLLGSLLLGLLFVISGIPPLVLQAQVIAFLTIFVPVYAALLAFTMLLAGLLPLRGIQIAVPLLWLYSVLAPFHLPSIKDTILSPLGSYVVPVFLSSPYTREPDASSTSNPLTMAILNIVALLAVAVVSLVLLGVILQRRRNHDSL